jgi:hypothetical protein
MSSTRLVQDRPRLTTDSLDGLLLKRIAVVVTGALVAAGLVFLPSWGSDEIGQMQVQEQVGDVVILRDGETVTVDGDTSIKPGDVIKTVDSGSALLRLSGLRLAFLQPYTEVVVTDEESLEVRQGKVKAEISDGDTMSLSIDKAELTPLSNSASFRVDTGPGFVTTAVYQGEAQLTSPGQESLTLAPLFQASIAGGELPVRTSPYTYSERDSWDQEELEAVINLDDQLQQKADGLTAQLDGRRPSLAFYRELRGGDVSTMRPYLKRSTGDVLIGFTIARNTPGRFEQSFQQAFSYHDEGGQWGVVATILEARSKPLLAQLTDIVLATGVADGGGSEGSQPILSVAAAQEANDPGSSTPGGGENPGDPGGEDPTDPGGTDPGGGGTDPGGGDGDPGDCQDGTDCDTQEAVDEILGCDEPDAPPGVCPAESGDGGGGEEGDGPFNIFDGGGSRMSVVQTARVEVSVPLVLGAWLPESS